MEPVNSVDRMAVDWTWMDGGYRPSGWMKLGGQIHGFRGGAESADPRSSMIDGDRPFLVFLH